MMMDETGKQMELELALEQVVEAKQYLIDLDRKLNQLREGKRKIMKAHCGGSDEKLWMLCSGSTFVSCDLDHANTLKYMEWQQTQISLEIENARRDLKEKVVVLAELEGPDSALAHLNEGFSLAGLDTKGPEKE